MKGARSVVAVLAALAVIALVSWLARGGTGGAQATGARPARAANATAPDLAPVPAVVNEGRAALEAPGMQRTIEAGGASLFTGVLVDAATQEPLPGYRLDPVGLDPIQTDGEGRFASAVPVAHGTIEIHFVDLPAGYRTGAIPGAQRVMHPSAAPVTLRVAAGPTYVFDTQLPPGTDYLDFDVTLQNLHPRSLANMRGEGNKVPLRAGPTSWCRYRPIDAGGLAGPWRLRIESLDGKWRGETQVASARGVHPGTVAMKIVSYGKLMLKPLDDEGAPVPEVCVQLTGPAEWTHTRPAYATPAPSSPLSRDGKLTSPPLPTGTYELDAWSPAHRRVSRRIVLAPGRNEVEVQLAALPVGGDIAGQLRSAAGKVIGGVHMRLVTEVPEHRELDGMIVWSLDEGFGRFRFAKMPAGNYRVEVRCQDFYTWEPSSINVTAPRPELLFTRKDDAETFGLRFGVKDAASGAPVNGFTVHLWNDTGGAWMLAGAQSGMICYPNMPRGAAWRWRIEREGFAAASGTHADLRGDAVEVQLTAE